MATSEPLIANLYFDNDKVHYYFNSGKILYSNVIDSIVPGYVLDRMNDDIYEISNISLKKGDLIPIYGDRMRDSVDESVMKYTFGFSTLQLNDESYFSLNFYPQYKHNNLSLLIDASPDLRQQLYSAKCTNIDAVLLTHFHSDHISGLTDMRAISLINDKVIPVYMTEDMQERISHNYKYIFNG